MRITSNIRGRKRPGRTQDGPVRTRRPLPKVIVGHAVQQAVSKCYDKTAVLHEDAFPSDQAADKALPVQVCGIALYTILNLRLWHLLALPRHRSS
jgi:hypothetical protein